MRIVPFVSEVCNHFPEAGLTDGTLAAWVSQASRALRLDNEALKMSEVKQTLA